MADDLNAIALQDACTISSVVRRLLAGALRAGCVKTP
jgi:hypothetical protein